MPMKRESHVNADRIDQMATDFVRQQSTMTLATTDGQAAWAAPVYYLFHKNAFFFFSDPQSRHIREASANERVAAAIHPCSDGWQEIRGVQMSGVVRQVRAGVVAAQAFGAYIKRFPFIKDFFEPGQALDLAGISKRFKVKFYRFDPDLVYYQDNQIRFGFRAEAKLLGL
jgi:uncharacterized protein YhbP (UPF0306 family)